MTLWGHGKNWNFPYRSGTDIKFSVHLRWKILLYHLCYVEILSVNNLNWYQIPMPKGIAFSLHTAIIDNFPGLKMRSKFDFSCPSAKKMIWRTLHTTERRPLKFSHLVMAKNGLQKFKILHSVVFMSSAPSLSYPYYFILQIKVKDLSCTVREDIFNDNPYRGEIVSSIPLSRILRTSPEWIRHQLEPRFSL